MWGRVLLLALGIGLSGGEVSLPLAPEGALWT